MKGNQSKHYCDTVCSFDWSSASSEKPHLTECKGEKRLLIGRGRYLQCKQCNTAVIGELHQISRYVNACMVVCVVVCVVDEGMCKQYAA